ncbi:MAG: DUF2330 domain-containing protein [Myxococcota bacterium]|nr:DUF2330 domain-containing protein [Myxococcota bacterium]
MRWTPILALTSLMLSSHVALACGGMFCDATTPVNQAAERILFAETDDGLEMHVRITYAGPPTEFGWLLPVPRDVQYELGSEALFNQLDNQYAPIFNLITEFIGDCDFPAAANDSGFAEGGAGGAGGGGGGIQVLAREPVGPYDLAVLLPSTVDDLRTWLESNEYQIPDQIDEKLTPYIEMDAAFIALKLLPSSGEGDIQPLSMRFAGDIPSIPIIPTSVAADPDMGMLVHLLGRSRAVPTNYRHVEINEAALDWFNSGSNYADVVSQAIDEAGGQAFTTDFAGQVRDRQPLFIADLNRLESIDELNFSLLSDEDYRTGLRAFVTLPENITFDEFSNCIFCYDDQINAGEIAIDLDGYRQAIRDEINPRRSAINALFARNPYLTRLYSTMSADEMTVDPAFGFNADLEDVDNLRTPTQYIRCEEGGFGDQATVIRGPSGVTFTSNQSLIRRMDGETVRGMDVPGARLIEQYRPAGQPTLLEDKREQIAEVAIPGQGTGGTGGAAGAGGAGGGAGFVGLNGNGWDGIGASSDGGNDSGGCACDVGQQQSTSGLFLVGLMMFGMLRRRRGHSKSARPEGDVTVKR